MKKLAARCAQRPSEAGYSAIEMMMAVGILGILSAMAVVQIDQQRPGLKGDGAMRVAMSQLTSAREQAITQRRSMRLNFDTANSTVQIVREEVPGPALTVLTTIPFEGGVKFNLIVGQPDSPDAFGRTAAVAFNAATEIKFTPDGTLVNQNGASLNGTVFLSIPNMGLSARAVTVLGSTGRIRGYRWDGRKWVLV
jgi:prepilin-type N-terminal cleavage/methylation domain-containing protein